MCKWMIRGNNWVKDDASFKQLLFKGQIITSVPEICSKKSEQINKNNMEHFIKWNGKI